MFFSRKIRFRRAAAADDPAHQRGLRAPGVRAAFVVAGYVVIAAVVQVLPSGSSRAAGIIAPDVVAGGGVWLAGNCNSCHALFGLGGHLGPDLTNIVRLRTAPVVSATVQTGRLGMPGYALSADESRQLIAYLDHVGGTGVYPMKERPLRWLGERVDDEERETRRQASDLETASAKTRGEPAGFVETN